MPRWIPFLAPLFAMTMLATPFPLLSQDSVAPGPHETILVQNTGGEWDEAEQPDLSAVEQRIIEQTNAFRQKHDREPLEPNKILMQAAQKFGDYMARTGRYGHRADGQTPSERVKAAGYEFCVVRENIAYSFRSRGFSTEELAKKFVTGWKESPGHRRNMLAKHVVETGVAVAKSDETDAYFAVQLFGRPKSMSVDFEIVNKSDLTVSYRVADRILSLPPRVVRSHQSCSPQQVKFYPVTSDIEVNDPPTPIETIKVEGGEQLSVTSAESGYQVEVSEMDEAPGPTQSGRAEF